jgi:hypothetical protein
MVATKPVFLIWGGEGWVAGHLKTLLESQGTSFWEEQKSSNANGFFQERRSTLPQSACRIERLSSQNWRE